MSGGLAPYGHARRFALKLIEADGTARYSRVSYVTRGNAQTAGRRWARQKAGRRYRTEQAWERLR